MLLIERLANPQGPDQSYFFCEVLFDPLEFLEAPSTVSCQDMVTVCPAADTSAFASPLSPLGSSLKPYLVHGQISSDEHRAQIFIRWIVTQRGASVGRLPVLKTTARGSPSPDQPGVKTSTSLYIHPLFLQWPHPEHLEAVCDTGQACVSLES